MFIDPLLSIELTSPAAFVVTFAVVPAAVVTVVVIPVAPIAPATP
jgi:hypothetical protein